MSYPVKGDPENKKYFANNHFLVGEDGLNLPIGLDSDGQSFKDDPRVLKYKTETVTEIKKTK